ncbi:hypothetical protein ES703_124419 [subsurface metagenome]
MLVTEPSHSVVSGEFIGKQGGVRRYLASHKGNKGVPFNIGHNLGNNFATPLNRTNNFRFAFCPTTTLTMLLATNTHLSLDLLGGDTAPSRRHAVDSLKPYPKRRRRLVKYRSSGRVNLMSTVVALIAWTASNSMVLCYPVALWAFNSFRPAVLLNPLQTGIIGREFLVKIFSGILLHFYTPSIPKVYHKYYMLSRDNYHKEFR